jgi:hypothetical protein
MVMGMAENYKHLYEQMKKMVAMYQDEIVPGMRKSIEELEKNQIKVRCKDCQFSKYFEESGTRKCRTQGGLYRTVQDDDFCSYGERREGE